MATFKGVVSEYKRGDGTYNVKIRVTHQRKVRYITTPFYVSPLQVTRGLKIKDVAIIDKIEEEIRRLRDTTNRLGFAANNIDVDRLVEYLTQRHDDVDFLEVWQEDIDNYKLKGEPNTALSYQTALNSLKRFNKNQPLYASKITKAYMLEYFQSISNLTANSIRSYMRALKAGYKHAQLMYNDEDLDKIVFRHNVFSLIKLPQMEANKENVMGSVSDMQKIIDVPYSGTWSYDFAKDMYILSFCCFGTNIVDFIRMKKTQLQDGVIRYRRKKTSSKSKTDADIEILVNKVAQIIIDKYSGDPEYLIDFQGHSRSKSFCRRIHYAFQKAGLEDVSDREHRLGNYKGKYTFYSNRHSMASFARNECDQDIMVVHGMLNHAVPKEFKTTDVYLRKDYQKLWKANEKLMSLFDWSFYLKQEKGA